MKDTAHPSDTCTCGHVRGNHTNIGMHRQTVCNICCCDRFTKEALTFYDERAAYNWEKSHQGER